MKTLSIRIGVLMLLFACCGAQAQQRITSSDKIAPKWIKNAPVILSDAVEFVATTTYTSNSQLDQGSSLDALANNLPREWNVSSRVQTNESGYLKRGLNGVEAAEQVQEFDMQVISEGKPVNIRCQLLDEYWVQVDLGSGIQYKHSQLYQVAKPNYNGKFCPTEITNKYGGRGLWRSAIIPGWGQFHKGANLKGGLILGGTALLVGGIVYTEMMRKDYMNKIEKTHVAEHKRAYATKSDNFAMGRNICIGALGALYVYNLIDAIVAPGARYVKFSRVDRSGNTYALTPTLTATGDPAMAMAITF